MKNESETKVITGTVRLSYANLWTPKSIKGGVEKYSVSLLIPKSDTKTVTAIQKAIDAAILVGSASKFGGKVPSKGNLKLPLRDGDDRDDEAYKGCWFLNANSTTPPQIVDRACNPILDRSEIYSGCYARASITFYPFSSDVQKGIACGLQNIQKLRDGEPLGGSRSTAEMDFATEVEDDFLA